MDRSSRAIGKWGRAGVAGWQVVPDLLLKNQKTLGLTATEMLVLLNITMHWWYAETRPFPRSSAIARRMDIDARTVQRAMSRLQSLGLVRKVREAVDDNKTRREVCDLSGLVKRLGELAETDASYLFRSSPKKEAGHEAISQ